MLNKTPENLVDTLRNRHLYAEKLWMWAMLLTDGSFMSISQRFTSMVFYIDLLNQGKTK